MMYTGDTPISQISRADTAGIHTLYLLIFADLAMLKVGAAIRATTAGRIPLKRAEEIKKKCANGTDLKEFSEVPFLLHQPPMLLRKTADLCFQRAGFKPKIYAEAMNTDLIVSLYPCHMGAFFCRKAKVPSLLEQFSDCNVFPVKHEDMLYKSPVYFAKRKDLRPPSHLMDFELLVKHAWEKLAQF